MSAPQEAITRLLIKRLIVDALQLQIDPTEMADDEVLFGEGLGGDSMATLQIIFAVEEAFGIDVDDDDLDVALFDSVNSLAEYVTKKLDQS